MEVIVLFIFPNSEKILWVDISAIPAKILALLLGFVAAPLNDFPTSRKDGRNEIQRLIPSQNVGNITFVCLAILEWPLLILSRLLKNVAFQTDIFKVAFSAGSIFMFESKHAHDEYVLTYLF